MPPLVIVALGALGVAALSRVIVAGVRTAGGALHPPGRDDHAPTTAQDGEVIKLVRDPVTGEYRPSRR